MPSSYTSSLKLTLPQTGDLIGSWGGVVNSGVTSLVDQAVAGSVTITMTADTNYTLTSTNGASDEARNMFINVSGGPHTATRNVICPAVSKLFVVTNNTSGAQAILFKTSAGTGVTIPNGVRAIVYCDGTNVGLVNMISLVDTATVPFTGSLELISPDAGITTVADTAGFSGLSVFVDGTAENTTIGMHGDTAGGTTAGVSNASLGVVTFDSASAGMIRATAAGAPLYFATNTGVKVKIQDNGNVGIGTTSPTSLLTVGGTFAVTGASTFSGLMTVLGVDETLIITAGPTEGGELRINNPSDVSVGGYLDVSLTDVLRLRASNNNSVIQIGQIGGGLTGGVVQFYTENTLRMLVNASGNVGINVVPSAWGSGLRSLDIGLGSVYADTGASFTSYACNLYNSGVSNIYKVTGYATNILQNAASGSIAFNVYPSGTGGASIGGQAARVQLDSSNFTMTTPNGGMGYGTGAGGTVTQTPSLTSAVTLNKPCGRIQMDTSSWTTGTVYTFTLNNSLIQSTDVLIVNVQSASAGVVVDQFTTYAHSIGTGTAKISVTCSNSYGSGTIVYLNFVLIKGVTA